MPSNNLTSQSFIEAPPPYELASNNGPSESPRNASEPLSLVIQDTKYYSYITSTVEPEKTLYRLSQPILSGSAKIIGLEKYVYKVKDGEQPQYSEESIEQKPIDAMDPPKSLLEIGESYSLGPRMTCRRAHLYDIKQSWFQTIGTAISIVGMMTNQNQTFKEACLWRLPLKSSWTVAQLEGGKEVKDGKNWKAEMSGRSLGYGKGSKGVSWVWKDNKGEIVAAEVEVPIGGAAEEETKAKLDVRKAISEKEMDFLVAAWVARVAFEAVEEAKEPMTWAKCESTRLRFVTSLTTRSQTHCRDW
jgi:hypothetical protein